MSKVYGSSSVNDMAGRSGPAKKPWAPVLVLFMAAFIFMAALCYVGYRKGAEAQRQLAELEHMRDVLAAQVEADVAAVQAGNVDAVALATGYSPARVERDKGIISGFLGYALTWDSSSAYEERRLGIMKDYGIDGTCSFMQEFLPPDVVITQGDGTKVSYIDTHGRNSSYEGCDIIVRGVSGTTYSYLVPVRWSSADKGGNEAISTALFLCSVDSDGQLSDLMGYTMAQ